MPSFDPWLKLNTKNGVLVIFIFITVILFIFLAVQPAEYERSLDMILFPFVLVFIFFALFILCIIEFTNQYQFQESSLTIDDQREFIEKEFVKLIAGVDYYKDLDPERRFIFTGYYGQFELENKLTNKKLYLKYNYIYHGHMLKIHLGPINETTEDYANQIKHRISVFKKNFLGEDAKSKDIDTKLTAYQKEIAEAKSEPKERFTMLTKSNVVGIGVGTIVYCMLNLYVWYEEPVWIYQVGAIIGLLLVVGPIILFLMRKDDGVQAE
jgi:hypothetical protein